MVKHLASLREEYCNTYEGCSCLYKMRSGPIRLKPYYEVGCSAGLRRYSALRVGIRTSK